jgi:hypothetical protein
MVMVAECFQALFEIQKTLGWNKNTSTNQT